MPGTVAIVGAGPGPTDLLTLRALRLLRAADVVLHDDLVSQDVVDLCARSALIINVGKRCGQPGFSQQQINQLMIDHARHGRAVLRLKSGDPSVFGRLGEELDTLREAAIPFEIVPGVTAATAAAAAAELTLTDRRSASSLLVVTAHRAGGPMRLPTFSLNRTTIVVYMPGPNYAEIAQVFTQAGLEAGTPCVIVSNAGRAKQQVRSLVLHDLETVRDVPAPAVLIVGRVARAAAEAKISPSIAQECLCAVAARECPSHPKL